MSFGRGAGRAAGRAAGAGAGAGAGGYGAMNMGTGGFHHAMYVDNDIHHRDRTDLRSRRNNRGRRKNITNRSGGHKRVPGVHIPGMTFDKILQCTACNVWKAAKYFHNHAVSIIDRADVGLNQRCRSCQSTQYTNEGYKKEDDFVTDSDIEEDMTDDHLDMTDDLDMADDLDMTDDDHDMAGKCHQCGILPIAESKKCKHGHTSLCDGCIAAGIHCVTCDDLLMD